MKISHSFSRLFLIALVLACFPLCPMAEAVLPAPDGGYPGGNTAEGQSALLSLTTGGFNTAVGYFSLTSDTTGSFNTAIGVGTLFATTGSFNTATGAGALLSNTTGGTNTADGTFALLSNTTGIQNTAVGVNALNGNTTSSFNTAVGANALLSNTVGGGNSAFGQLALASNTTGRINTASGETALYSNSTGSGNIALGYGAGANLIAGDSNIDIGNYGMAAESGTIRIGTQGTQTATYVGGIFGATLTDGAPVLVGTDGHLGTAVSSVRFKNDVKPMGKASEAILSLKPVTFHYKKERDPKGIPHFGLVAEHVEKVNPDLVVRDKEGKPYTVRYDAVNAMLLNEFLKEHRKVERLEAALGAVNERLKEQDAKIQKVSAQIEMGKRAPRVVLNNP